MTGVAVVGAGLAGITAALRLAEHGLAVTVLEARPRLGGRACSFDRGALVADNGQHVILRCYTRYRELLGALGVAAQVPLQDRLDIPVAAPGGPRTRIRRGRVGPAPLHLLPAVLGYRALTPRERLAAARGAAALRRVDPGAPGTDERTFGTWLHEHGQTARVRALLWDLVTVPALNLPADEASLALAAMVFRTGVLDTVSSGDLGVPQVPLGQLHDAPVRRRFAELGVELRTGTRVADVVPAAGGAGFELHGQARGGEPFAVRADQVVVAVPHQQAARLVPEAGVPGAKDWQRLGQSAIVNTHLHFDRRVLDVPFLAAPGSPAQWVFDRSTGLREPVGQYVATSVSAAVDLVQRPAREIVAGQLAALRELLPGVRAARLLDSFVTREPAATFYQRPGTAALRPPARTPLPGLVLAGAWTATGWPDTLEGAVRSGHAAADALLATAPRDTGREREWVNA